MVYRIFYLLAWIVLFLAAVTGPHVQPDYVMEVRIIFGITGGFLVIDRYFNWPHYTPFVFLALAFYLGADAAINYQVHVVPVVMSFIGSLILRDQGRKPEPLPREQSGAQ